MSELSGLYAIWYREFKVFLREKSRVISSLINPLLWLIILGTGLGSSVSLKNYNYQTFIYPGVLAMVVMFSSIFFGAYVVWDKKIDFLKEVLITPLNRTTIFFGKVLGGTTDALIQVLILILLGGFFGINYTALMLIETVLLLFILTAGLVGLGLIIGSIMESPEGFGLITSFIIFPLFFLSGSLYPVENLPGWMTVFVRIDPVTYAVDALREVILGITNFGVLTDMAVLIVFSITMIGIGTVAFNRMKL
jgi:ABC-2 type transport system permease protein